MDIKPTPPELVLPKETASTRPLGPLIILSVIAAAYCIWILSLPLFPTQDGPMHLYYARVMQALIFHVNPGIFPEYFNIKHLFPPYSLYYYLLIALAHFVPFTMADKLIVCFYVVLFLFGFRYLARAIGPAAETVTMLATPLALSWPLVMGFVNFCLSTALAFFALGLWVRVAKDPQRAGNTLRQSGFFALCVAMMLTHPVPLLLVLGYAAIDLVLGFWLQHRVRAWPQIAVFLAAASTLIYVKAFTVSNVLRQEDTEKMPYLYTILHNAGPMLAMQTLTVFGGRTLIDRFYRGSLLLLLIIAIVLGARELSRAYRARTWNLANTWFVLGLALGVLVPIIPPDLNNSHYFSARLVVMIWLVLLLAASGAQIRRAKLVAHTAGGFALVMTACILFLGARRIAPVARELARVERGPIAAQHDVFLSLLDQDHLPVLGINYDPYAWSGARVVRSTDSILYTPPWLDLPIIPLGMRNDMPGNIIAPLDLDSPLDLRRALLKSESQRAFIFSHITSVVVMHGVNPVGDSQDALLGLDPVRTHRWVCSPDGVASVCGLGRPAERPTP